MNVWQLLLMPSLKMLHADPTQVFSSSSFFLFIKFFLIVVVIGLIYQMKREVREGWEWNSLLICSSPSSIILWEMCLFFPWKEEDEKWFQLQICSASGVKSNIRRKRLLRLKRIMRQERVSEEIQSLKMNIMIALLLRIDCCCWFCCCFSRILPFASFQIPWN